jgi:hypothetical protein
MWHPLHQDDPQHPAANGLVERPHRTLKAAIMCHAVEQWTEALPLVLLGIRTAYNEDLQSSAAELVYGEPLRVSGELLVPAAPKVRASTVQQLRRHMDQLRPTPAARYASPATFVHMELWGSTHVFLRQDATCRSLEPPYSGPHRVIARTDKTQLSCVACGSPYQRTELSPLTYWRGLFTTPAAHQPSPAALRQNQSPHRLSLQRPHTPGALYASRLVSAPKLSFPREAGAGGLCGDTHITALLPLFSSRLPHNSPPSNLRSTSRLSFLHSILHHRAQQRSLSLPPISRSL